MMSRNISSIALTLAFAGLFAACGMLDGNDSESHFLKTCSVSCSGSLTCVCGLCTKACTESSECTTLDSRAECLAVPKTLGCQAGATKTCDVACASSGDCTAIGAGYGCYNGRCRSMATSSEGGVSGPTCDTGGVPDRPSGATAGGDVGAVFSQDSVDLGISLPDMGTRTYMNIGFNLDRLCTSAGDPSVAECALPSGATGAADGTNGIDNAVGQIFQLVDEEPGGWVTPYFGSGPGLLVRLLGYNAQPNDARVEAVLLNGDGPELPDGSSGVPVNGGARWTVDARSLIGSDLSTPRFADPNAYVRDGLLVASFDFIEMNILYTVSYSSYLQVVLPINQVVLTCDLSGYDASSGTGGIDCTMGGRVLADDLLHRLSGFTNLVTNRMCIDDPIFQTFARRICSITDTSLAHVPTSPCDSLSFGMKFHAMWGLLGTVSQSPLPNSSNYSSFCGSGNQPSDLSCDIVRAGGLPTLSDAGSVWNPEPSARDSSTGG